MFPLSSISSALPVSSVRPQTGVGAPELSPFETPEVRIPLPSSTEAGATQGAGESFSTVLGRMVDEVNTRQNVAADTVSALQSGQNVSLHQAVIAMEEANVSFQLMVEVRNKLLESYQEIMRMQV